ncbi:MAG: surface carbohydrate biosynthesis protein [Hyphomicrobiales bacterium]
MPAPKTLLLPVETVAREFDGKLLLALFARERNWRVILGEQGALRARLSTLPRGVYVSKSARAKNGAYFEQMHALGHRVAVLDEEALVRQTDDIYAKKHERNALSHVDLMMTWGEENTKLWLDSGMLQASRVEATGNPRVDMLRQELRAYHAPELESIRRRFGDYVLFNSNYATVNHFIAGENRFRLASWVAPEDRQQQTSAILTHKRALFEAFLNALPKVARAIAPLNLVVRPHPSENDAAWEEALKGEPNAAVVFEGSVVPWIIGSRVLLHNGCTTAVEAAIAGVTSIAFRPVTSSTLDNPLPNDLSLECRDEAGLIDQTLDILKSGPRQLDARQVALLDYFVDGRAGPFGCERMLDALERHGLDRDRGTSSLRARLPHFFRAQTQAVKRRIEALKPESRSYRAYGERKFPDLTEAFMAERIARFQNTLSRFEGARARPYGRNVFVIE